MIPGTLAEIENPPALVIARRERRVGCDWFQARSWFGGEPKLGAEAWPRDGKGKPFHFMAQLDLSEIAAAGGGQTALPVEGAFAFFLLTNGGTPFGRIVHVNQSGTHTTPAPDDLGSVEDIGGDSFVGRTRRFGPRAFPYWPVEFRKLPFRAQAYRLSWDGLDRLRKEQAQAIAQLYQTREFDFSAGYEARNRALGDVPLYWLTALMFAERVPHMRDQVAAARARGIGYIESSTARLKALNAGLPPPPGQGPIRDPAKERTNSESWLASGRETVANADAHKEAIDAYVARVEAAVKDSDLWSEISPKDAKRFDELLGEAGGAAFVAYSKYILPRSWRDYATDAIKLMAAGPDVAYTRLPQAWRDLINAKYRLPACGAHLLFGVGDNVQGNGMFGYPGMRMVLQLTNDDMMYWPFGDNGVYQFWMPADALRTADVSKATITFEMH